MSFELFEFQTRAVEQMCTAVAEWVHAANERGRPPTTVDGEPIPLLGHLTAITGAGKTPILANVIGSIGPSVVLWTTNKSVVVDQTVEKLNGVYRHFLPPKTMVLGDTPTQEQWEALVTDEDLLAIWCLTVASWNNPTGLTNSAEARLNIHRPAPDWGGPEAPWTQLGKLARPLWVVYDEGHGQTDVQLDQLLGLDPVGILAATGTPRFSDKIDALRAALELSEVYGPVARKAMVEVPTSEVAKAGLLKSSIEMVDLNMESESQIFAVVDQMTKIEQAAARDGLTIRPRALYVTETSNDRTTDPRPVVIWETLTQKLGVDPRAIAVATSTRELPPDADRVTELGQLKPRHRHIIFNKRFEEGWDDPEAYLAYFDGETRSARRLKQIIGRVIRQPGAAHFAGTPELNTAYLFVSSPDEHFAGIVAALQRHLVAEYGSDEYGEANVKATRRSERLDPIPLREGLPDLSLPLWSLVATGLDPLIAALKTDGERPYPAAALEAPGVAHRLRFDLTEQELRLKRSMEQIGHHIRSTNRDYFTERVRNLSKEALDWLDAEVLSGPMFDQTSAALSPAQEALQRLAATFVDDFEAHVQFERHADPDEDTWRPSEVRPTRPTMIDFTRAAHPRYPDAPSYLNNDEKEMAQALDGFADGWWMRNPPTRASGGYGLPMPVQVAGSQNFYPDFLWWIDKTVFAIDTTGVHILGPKVRGKLFSLPLPHVALATRGRVTASLDTVEDRAGWTLLLPGPTGPLRTHFPDATALLVTLRAGGR